MLPAPQLKAEMERKVELDKHEDVEAEAELSSPQRTLAASVERLSRLEEQAPLRLAPREEPPARAAEREQPAGRARQRPARFCD